MNKGCILAQAATRRRANLACGPQAGSKMQFLFIHRL
jgi:hypothetical protein